MTGLQQISPVSIEPFLNIKVLIFQALERRERKGKKKDQASKDQPLDYGTWVVIVSAVILVLCLTASIIREYRRRKGRNQVVPTDAS